MIFRLEEFIEFVKLVELTTELLLEIWLPILFKVTTTLSMIGPRKELVVVECAPEKHIVFCVKVAAGRLLV